MDESALYRLKNLNSHNVISVFKDQFKIGRATTNDLSIVNNRYISSTHCIFEYDHGHLYICDTSSNGTLINRSRKITKNESRVELHSGDVVHIVFRHNEPESNVVFQVELPISPKVQELSPFDEDTQPASYPSIPPLSPIQTQENEDLSNLMSTSVDVENKPTTTYKEEPRKEFAMEAGDDMEDVLTCVCCQDILSNPITLEPCLHAFCNDCYASWEAIQRTCPKCRAKVTGKKKNVVINGILEAFLKAYPHKRPTSKLADDTEEKSNVANNSKHAVGLDGMYLYNTQHPFNAYDDEEEEEEEMVMSDDNDDDDDDDEDDDDDDDDAANNNIPMAFAPIVHPPPVANIRFVCRECPGNVGPAATTTGFQCPQNQNHILCQCCIQPMPDRRDEPGIHQHCEICRQFFCNIYFQQCPRVGCLGCLNRLRDFNFAPRHLVNLVNDNSVESQIVETYLTNNHKTIRDLLIECCDHLDRHEFTCQGIYRTDLIPSEKVVCYKCGLKMFKELAYQYRVNMKQDDIYPVALRNRDDCYYGRKCRTQYAKPGHAQKLNHACEQTKF